MGNLNFGNCQLKQCAKRLIAVMLIINLVFIPYIAQAVQIIESGTQDKAIEILNCLGIMSNVEFEGRSNEFLSRGEFASIIFKLNCLSVNLDGNKFLDVEQNSDYSKYIESVTSAGYMKPIGNGMFAPNLPVSTQDAMLAIVKTLRYDVLIPYRGSLLSVANELKIFKSMDLSKKLTRGEVAQIVYKALDTQVYSVYMIGTNTSYYKGETLVSVNFKLTKGTGVLTKYYDTALDSEGSSRESDVEINGVVYTSDYTYGLKYFGFNTVFYFDEDNNIMAIAKSDNKSLKINATDLVQFDNGKLIYKMPNDSDAFVNISPKAYVIYNGMAINDFDPLIFKATQGSVELIDNTNDGKYDVVKVINYKYCFVNTVNVTNKIIYDKGSINTIDLNSEDKIVYASFADNNGKSLQLTDLNKLDVIAYTLTSDSSKILIRGIVSKSQITGVLQEIDDEKWVVDGINYTFVITPNLTTPIIGNKYTFYLNNDNDIIAFDNFELSFKSVAYLIDYAKGTGINDLIDFKILNSEGKVEVIKGAHKIKIDDVAQTQPDILLEVLKSSLGELIVCGRNKNNEISWINTLNVNSFGSPHKENSLFRYYEGTTSLKYKKDTKTFSGKLSLSNNTLVFDVPLSSEDSIATDDDYKITDISRFSDTSDYILNAYTMSDSMVLADICLYKSDITSGSSVKSDRPMSVIQKITDTVDLQGGLAKKIYVYSGQNLISVVAKPSAVVGLKVGDTIRYSTNQRGEIDYPPELDFSVSEKAYKLTSNPTNSSTNFADSAIQISFGSVYEVAGDVCAMVLGEKYLGERLTKEQFASIQQHNLIGANIYVYDDTITIPDKKVRPGTVADVIGRNIDANNYSRVIARVRYGLTKEIVVYRYHTY